MRLHHISSDHVLIDNQEAMFSRIIIEQKLADLELALTRQDELIKSQREVIRGLKDLISMEYQNAWQSVATIAAPVAAPVPVAVVAPRAVSSSTNTSSKRTLEQASATSTIPTSTGTTQRTSMSVQEAMSLVVSDSAKKRAKMDRDSTDSSSSSSRTTANTNSAPTTAAPPLTASTPAHAPVTNRVVAAPSPPMIISSKKRRAIEKVKQLCTILPRFSDIRYGLTSSSSAATTTTANPSSGARRTPTPNNTTPTTETTSNNTFAPIPRIRKTTTTAFSDTLAKLQSLTTFDARLEELKDLNTQLRIRTNDTRKLLDAGGRAILFEWIAEIDTDSKPSKNTGIYLDYLVNLLDQSTWTAEQVIQTRYDKVLRKIYKRFSEHKDIMSPTLSSIVREAWNKYRLVYRNSVQDAEDD